MNRTSRVSFQSTFEYVNDIFVRQNNSDELNQQDKKLVIS